MNMNLDRFIEKCTYVYYFWFGASNILNLFLIFCLFSLDLNSKSLLVFLTRLYGLHGYSYKKNVY